MNEYPDPSSKWGPNYNYMIKSTIQVEGRKSYIKNLRAMALYMEEEMTDEEFHLYATNGIQFPRLDTYKIEGVEEI